MEKKKPPSNFVIPKKRKLDPPPVTIEELPSPEISGKIEIVEATTEQRNELAESAKKSMDKNMASEEGWKHMVASNVKMIENHRLRHNFQTYMKKHTVEKELLMYRIVYDDEEIQKITENGLCVNSDGISDIGDPRQGVLLYPSPATAFAGRFLYRNVPIKVMVFRVTNAGKRHEVPLSSGQVAPSKSKKHNCHVMMKTETNSAKFHRFILEHSLAGVYYYEYLPNMTDVYKIPAMILPHAIITYELQENALPNSQKAFNKINRTFLNFRKTEECKHTLVLNSEIEGTLFKPYISKTVPSILNCTKATPTIYSINDLNTFPELLALRSPEYFGKLLTSEAVFIYEYGMATHYVLQFPRQHKEFVNVLRDEKCILVNAQYPWTTFYIPSGNIATEFGLPYQESSLHVIVYRMPSNENVQSLYFCCQESFMFSPQWTLANEFEKTATLGYAPVNFIENLDEDSEDDKEEDEQYTGYSPDYVAPVFRTPRGDKVVPKGILRTVGCKPRNLKVRWNDEDSTGNERKQLCFVKEFTNDTVPHHDHSILSFDEMRKQEEIEKRQQGQDEVVQLQLGKTDIENQGTDDVFKQAISRTNAQRESVERESSQSPQLYDPKRIPHSASISTNIPGSPTQFNRPPPVLHSPRSALPSAGPFSSPQPVPRFNGPPSSFILPSIYPPPPPGVSLNQLPPRVPVPIIRPPNDLQSIEPKVPLKPNFSIPPPPLPAPPPTTISTTTVIAGPVSAEATSTTLLSLEEIGEAEMDIETNDEDDSIIEIEPSKEVKPAPQEEENDILRMVFTPSQPTLLQSSLESLKNSVSLMELLQKKEKMNPIVTTTSLPELNTDSAPQSSQIKFSLSKPKSTANTNVLIEDDDDNVEKVIDESTKAGCSQDVDYRTSAPKDRDDRPKDIDDRFDNIPLPKISPDEEMKKRLTAQFHGKLRAHGKEIEDKVKSYSYHDMQMSEPNSNPFEMSSVAGLFPALSLATFGPEGISIGRRESDPAPVNSRVEEPEQIRSPSPEITRMADVEEYIPKTFLTQNQNQKQKCVIVPTESKAGYETYHGERPNSSMENTIAPKKSPKKPKDHDSVGSVISDEQVKQSWDNLMKKKPTASPSIDKEDGEWASDDESRERKNLPSTSSSSVIILSPPPHPSQKKIQPPVAPPGISNLNRPGNNYSGPSQSFRPNQQYNPNFNHQRPPFQFGFNPRGRGRGNFNNRGGHNYNMGHGRNGNNFFNQSMPAGNGWMTTLRPLIDHDVESLCILIDPELGTDNMKMNELNSLFTEMHNLKKLMKPNWPRVQSTIYLHNMAFENMKNIKNKSMHKYFQTFNDFIRCHPPLVEVLPLHFCDRGATGSGLANCIAGVTKHVGAKHAIFLTQNHKPESAIVQCMLECEVKVMSIRLLAQFLEKITGDPVTI
ncbi:SET domain-containing protein [Caenorhabditis elegans]|uniref:SET domain-containing protein n=2 Tax=Caenorhabditis elegans TaxID=6239 RepID=G5EDY1_CAEEL|nr:SET domain-containing protein [Caenorhabditis elegans]CAA93420.2 SET domain-containing protein [Caenorhabditis elegans]|eukprot:NP_502008.2 Uncharacterized protein CELE_T11G6.5 [Caenorhabditis elegans]